MRNEKLYDVIVIGGGPAGLTAALYLARAGCRTLVLERRGYGGQIALTNEVVNYPGVPKTSGMELTETMRRQAEDFGAEFLIAEARELSLFDAEKTVKTSVGDFRCLGVLLATGAQPKKAGFRGEEEFRGRGVSYCATCDGFFFKDQPVAVVGGGDTAVEEAMYLTKMCSSVTLIHRRDELRANKLAQSRALANEKLNIIYDTVVDEIIGDDKVSQLKLRNKKTDETSTLDINGVFIFVGYLPNNAFFPPELEVNEQGYIVTDDEMATNIPGVFAVGDVRQKKLRQVTTAVGDGGAVMHGIEEYFRA